MASNISTQSNFPGDYASKIQQIRQARGPGRGALTSSAWPWAWVSHPHSGNSFTSSEIAFRPLLDQRLARGLK